MQILLIEPDAVSAPLYAAGLTAAGHNVTVAASAQSAIQTADQQAPDLVVLEMQLGTHNGIAFLQEFRSYAEWQNVPVIIYSFQRQPIDQPLQDTLRTEYGVATWLYKPQTSMDALVSAVRRAGIAA